MKTLKEFNYLSADKQCEFVIDLIESDQSLLVNLIENESDQSLLVNLIQDGVDQGESKDNIVKLLLLLKSINKGQMTLLQDLKPLWIQKTREDKLNLILK